MYNRTNMDRRTPIANTLIKGVVAATFVAAVPSLGLAQSNSHLDPRWQGWIGCWQPVTTQSLDMLSANSARNPKSPLVCVVPAAEQSTLTGVVLATVVDVKVVAREPIEASGQTYASTGTDGCPGTKSAAWSTDGQRVFVRSENTCPGGLKRTSSRVLAMAPTGDWVDVQGVNTGGNTGVRTLRYRDAGMPGNLPSVILEALSGHSLAANTARIADGAPLTTADVVEASHKLDPAVVEAWLVERGQKFTLGAKQLIELADAGVPSNVTDAMVALSYPKAFAVDRSLHPGDGSALNAATETYGYSSTGRNIPVMMEPASPYDYSEYGYGYSPYGYSPYGYSPFSSFYSPLGYGGVAYGGWYWNRAPVIILRGDQPAQHTGYVVKGHGYTQSDPTSVSGSTAHPRTTVSPPASGSSNSAGRSSGSSSSGASSGSGRTAKPRP